MTNTKLYDSGAYIEVDSPTIKGWHSCSFEELLANQEEAEQKPEPLTWVGGPIPPEVTGPILAMVKQFPHKEVHICLYYSPTEKKWLHHFPKQNGTTAHVFYNDESYDPPKGYYFAGTMHTHPNLGAFFSGEDQSDQRAHNGLHFVLGLVEGALDKWKVNLSYHGKLYAQKEDLLQVPEELPEPDQEELKRLQEEVLEPPAPKMEVKYDSNSLPYFSASEYKPNYTWRDYMKTDEFPAEKQRQAEMEADVEDCIAYGMDAQASDSILQDMIKVFIKHAPPEVLLGMSSIMLRYAGEPALADSIMERLSEESDSMDYGE